MQSGSMGGLNPVHRVSADTIASAVQQMSVVSRGQPILHWDSREGARRANLQGVKMKSLERHSFQKNCWDALHE